MKKVFTSLKHFQSVETNEGRLETLSYCIGDARTITDRWSPIGDARTITDRWSPIVLYKAADSQVLARFREENGRLDDSINRTTWVDTNDPEEIRQPYSRQPGPSYHDGGVGRLAMTRPPPTPPSAAPTHHQPLVHHTDTAAVGAATTTSPNHGPSGAP
ncbi:hypothetical protein J6590_082712 [Homalodisca vitripennis]|nr:hypothetical protein J6590_082712 [Homalodisca vitripennis]